MRIYFLLFIMTGILFQSHAQTNKNTQLPGYPPDVNISTRTIEQAEEKVVEENIPDSIRVYIYAQVMPTFPGGGDTAFYSFVRKNLIYPEDAKTRNIIGTVFVQFIVEKDGSLSSIQFVHGRGISPSCDQAAIDVVSKSPKWLPGKNNGDPVRVKCTKRIKFEIY